MTNFEVFHLLMKHCVECLILLLKQNDLEGEIKDAKMSSFSFDFQTLIIFKFPLYFFMNYQRVLEILIKMNQHFCSLEEKLAKNIPVTGTPQNDTLTVGHLHSLRFLL